MQITTRQLKRMAGIVFGILMVAALSTGVAAAEDTVYLGDIYYYALYDYLPPGITVYSSDGSVVTPVQEGDKYYFPAPSETKGTVAPTATPTPAASKTPKAVTATPVQTETVPVAPTFEQTMQPTQQSPAPLAGLIVGLGVAVVLLRLRT